MNEKLSGGKVLSLSMMLFAMFFGAGNMIFPPMLGHMSGHNFLQSTLGFVATDAGLSILGIAAVVMVGTKLDDLGDLVGPKFSIFMGMIIYLLIGPLFALPRTASVSFEMAAVPFIPEGGTKWVFSLVFTAIFFAVTYAVSLNPSKLVSIVGKVLTPILLVSIAVIFVMSILNPVGEIGPATGDYAKIPFFKGMIEGYLALDGLAALAFAIVVIDAVKGLGVNEPKNIARYTLYAGVFAGVGLGIVYLALGYVGAQTSSGHSFGNGSELLNFAVHTLLGSSGNLVLGTAVLMACLTTAIGLSTSFADYFHSKMPQFSYKAILTVITLFSFAVSNVGLTNMITFTLPALIMIYPPAIALVFLSFARKTMREKYEPFALAVFMAFVMGVFDGLKVAGISLGPVSEVASKVPLFDLGLGWVLPSLVAFYVGMLPFVKFMPTKTEK